MSALKKPLIAGMITMLLQALLVAALAKGLGSDDLKIEAGLLMISGLSAAALFKDEAPFSLNQIWWIFALIFLGVTPAMQAAMHRTPWRDGDVMPATMLRANVLIIACLLLYFALRRMLSRRWPVAATLPMRTASFSPSKFYTLAVVLIAGCGAVSLWLYGIQGLFLRSAAEAHVLDRDTSLILLGDKGARGILLLLSLLTSDLYRQKKITTPAAILLLGAVLVLAFPLAIPRYLAFTFYGAWLIIFFKNRLARARCFFRSALAAVLLLAAPATSELRYIGTPELAAHLSHPSDIIAHTFLRSDFDAYSSLCRAMQFTAREGITNGRQLAGVALFFVPRKVWPEKPVGSGALLFSKHPLRGGFVNVACTYLGEGWINFGWAGAIIFTLLMALLIWRYDTCYKAGRSGYAMLFYPAAFGLLMFILRGDLLSSFAYTAGFFVAGYITLRLLRRAGAVQFG